MSLDCTRSFRLDVWAVVVVLLSLFLSEKAFSKSFCQDWEKWDSAPLAFSGKPLLDILKANQQKKNAELTSEDIEIEVAKVVNVNAGNFCKKSAGGCADGLCQHIAKCEVI